MKLFKSKKRIVSMLTVLAMVLAMMPAMAFADAAETAKVSVTIADKGSLVMTQEEVTVTDIDADGALTINDALYAAHEAAYEGGAAAGYASATSSWGLAITKLWGDTSGSYGYYVNNASAWSLADPVKTGDNVYAFVYSDAVSWSDTYSFFDKYAVEATAGEEVTLTLSYNGYDANWNTVVTPLGGATITVDGVATDAVTDAEGKAVIKMEAGSHVISATSASKTLVPPVCMATVAPAATDETAEVSVTIADKGELVAVQETVTVTDVDVDGALTINDALYAAHEAVYEGGAAAGYASAMSSWGLSITKLWGDTSGSYGYYVNNTSAWSLADPVKDGDEVYAFVYADQAAWSDVYCFFDKTAVTAGAGEVIELTLTYKTYDENWNTVYKPLESAELTADGEATGIVTDADGKAVFMVDTAGEYLVSATAEGKTLVPPVCVITVTGDTGDEGVQDDSAVSGDDDPQSGADEETDDAVTSGDDEGTVDSDKADSTIQTGDDFNLALYGFIALAALAAAAFCLRRKTCK